jgi:hypothetical protein
VDADGSLRSSGVELQENDSTYPFLNHTHAAFAGSLGFGSDWCVESGSAYLRKERPTQVPKTEGMRMRSAAIGLTHVLALTEEGQVYRWRASTQASQAPHLPELFEDIRELKLRRVAAGAWHGAAITDDGKLYRWCDASDLEPGSAPGLGSSPPNLGHGRGALYRPRCVEALAGMRIVSVAAGYQCTIVATDQGTARRAPEGCACNMGASTCPEATMPAILPTRPTFIVGSCPANRSRLFFWVRGLGMPRACTARAHGALKGGGGTPRR